MLPRQPPGVAGARLARRLLLGSLALSLLGSFSPAASAESPWRLLKRAESLRAAGRREREKGRKKRALEHLDRATDLFARLKREHPGWRVDFVDGKIDECVREFASVRGVDGLRRMEIARSFERLGNIPAAAEEYREALRANPELDEARERLRLLRRGGVRGEGGRGGGSPYGRGIASMEEAAALEKGGDLPSSRERLKDAIESFKAAIWADENSAEAYFSLGTAFLRLGQTREAVHYWGQAAASAGEDTPLGKQALYKLRLVGGQAAPSIRP